METSSLQITLDEAAPQSWKSSIGVAGNEADKAVIRAKLETTFGASFPVKMPNPNGGRDIKFRTDASDAAGIGLWGVQKRHPSLSFANPVAISTPIWQPERSAPGSSRKRALETEEQPDARRSCVTCEPSSPMGPSPPSALPSPPTSSPPPAPPPAPSAVLDAFTLSLAECAETMYTMKAIGTMASEGLSAARLYAISQELGETSQVIDLAPLLDGFGFQNVPEAMVLVAYGAVNTLLRDQGADVDVLSELRSMPMDTTALNVGRSRVNDMHSFHGNCVADYDRSPDIINGIFTVTDFKHYPRTNALRTELARLMGVTPATLLGETNHYYDASKCGIGWHGDNERRLVTGVRLGPGADDFLLKFQWFYHGEPVGSEARIQLNAGDIYFFSEKAVGTDSKKSSILTLRHAAGKDTCKYAQSKRKSREEHPVMLFPRP